MFLLAPFKALLWFFSISVLGALGYIVGVIGCVFAPGAYKLLRAVNTPKPVAMPLAILGATIAGGLALMLFIGGDFGGVGIDVPTHDLAINRLNSCAPAIAALDKPIRLTSVGAGNYHTEGAFGASSWQLDVSGPTKKATLAYAAEKHGGVWAFTGLALTIDGHDLDLASCMAGSTAPPPPRVARADREDVIGLWGTSHDRELVLTRFDPDGTFVSGMFVDEHMNMQLAGTWKIDDRQLVWHYDRARSHAPSTVWDQLGPARIEADVNPIVELSKVRMVIQEVDGRLTEMRPMDPARLVDQVRQMSAP